jgi:hypothetical protein
MKRTSKKLWFVVLACVLALGLGLLGCSSPSSTGGDSGGSATTGDSSSTGGDNGGSATTGGDNGGAATTGGDSSSDSTAAEAVPVEYQGSWYSKSEILPPEQETDQYELTVNADGSFALTDGGAALYAGTLKITDKPEAGWGEAAVDGKTVAIQLVNAQGIYKFIFNAGDDYDKDLKKIVFQR